MQQSGVDEFTDKILPGSPGAGRERNLSSHKETSVGTNMARRQHYIPCYLQAGFATPTWGAGGRKKRRRKWAIWAFEQGKPPKQATPEDWGVIPHFYEGGGRNIDPGWDKWDNQDAILAEKLRRTGMEQSLVGEALGLITRLAERTLGARYLLERSGHLAIDAALSETPDAYRKRWIQRARDGAPDLMELARKHAEQQTGRKDIKDEEAGGFLREWAGGMNPIVA